MKTKIRQFTTKKLYFGHASVRDYIIKECQEKQKDLLIKFKDQEMLVPCQDLQHYSARFYDKKIESKTGGKDYQLIDIRFNPNRRRDV